VDETFASASRLAFVPRGDIPSRTAWVATSPRVDASVQFRADIVGVERAAGRLLADPGVQNVNYRESAVAGRLKAQDAASAVARVGRGLAGERLVIGQAHREHDPRSV
jgi:hypothetical protein